MTEHYFSASPSGDAKTREIEVELAGATRTLLTAAGVFSPDHLDQGTAVLLRELEHVEGATPDGPILDLGCGWGPIALSAGLSDPVREVWAIDVNERSLDLTRANAQRLGLENIRAATPEEVPPELRFAEIHSNPPIRVGKKVLHDMLQTWLPRLRPGGRAFLVVAKHLGADSLQKWIATEFADTTVTRAARRKGFHVIEVQAPR